MRKRNKHVGLFLEEFLKPRVGGGPLEHETSSKHGSKRNQVEVVQNGAISSAKTLGYKRGYLVSCTIQIIRNQSM